MNRFSDEMTEFLRKTYKKYSRKETIALFNEYFNVAYSYGSIVGFMKRNRISSGRTGRFEKGHVPFVSGTKGYLKANKTSFKKGNRPYNYRPLGAVIKKCDGYLWKKVGLPNKWKQLHRIVWEEEHGPLKSGHVLIFLNGNREDVCLDNLMEISRSELSTLNKLGLLGSGNGEITQIAVNHVKLKQAIRKIERA